jgi:pyruvate ferredoxin oxidoreductase gamma subunit/2-oxoisovalerate ferredoxin oxidoreductase gamma subunit
LQKIVINKRVSMHEILFYGRGGQGMVSAAGLLVSAIARDNKYAQAFPYFGFERRGALSRAFLRIDEDPILNRGFIKKPDCIVVADPKLPEFVDVTAGLKQGGIAVLNTKRDPREVDLGVRLSKIGTIDASKIAEIIYGFQTISFTNYIMVGAFAALTGWVKLPHVIEAIGDAYEPGMAERNQRAAQQGFTKVRVHEGKGRDDA